MEIILKTFYNNLTQAKAGQNLDTSELSEYLMSRLLWPYIRGEKIRLDDLNYEAFDLYELDRLMEYVDDLEHFANEAGHITDTLSKSIPMVRTVKSFC